MKTLDLGKQRVTVDELLQSAEVETVLIRSKDGMTFVLEAADAFEREAADAFEREAAELAASKKCMDFLAQRSMEQANLSLEEIEQRLALDE